MGGRAKEGGRETMTISNRERVKRFWKCWVTRQPMRPCDGTFELPLDEDAVVELLDRAQEEELEACCDALRAMPDGKQFADALERLRLEALRREREV